jgi:hypothetical protein
MIHIIGKKLIVRKSVIYALIVFIGCFFSSALVQAQEKEDYNLLHIKLGGGAVYYYGAYDKSFNNFENDRLNYQANLSLGLALNKSKSPTIIGVFGSMGFINAKTIDFILQDQDYTLIGSNAANIQPNINNSYQVEFGLRLANVLRISTGAGRQFFEERTLINPENGTISTVNHLDYYSTTLGLQIGKGALGFFIDANFNYGLDFNNSILKPVAGLQLQF